jgi:large subunit ribosomal protein L9
VAEALAKLGKEVDRKIITMKDAKKVGDYVALVHYHKEVVVEIPVQVVAENAEELKAAAEAAKAAVAPVVEEAPAEEEEAEAPVAEEEAPAEA